MLLRIGIIGDSKTNDTITDELVTNSSDEQLTPNESSTNSNRKSIFWLISIFSMSSQNIFLQFFSVFAEKVGVKARLLGFLMSVRNLLQGLFQGPIGRLSDRFGRKKILLIGFIINFLIPIPLIFYHNIYFLVFIAITQAFSVSIIIPTWNAVLGDVTESNFRATFIGKITSIGRIVSVAITLLAAALFVIIEIRYDNILWGFEITWKIQYGFIFALASLNALLCIICIFFFKETRITSSDAKANFPKLRLALQDKKFARFLLINSLFGISMALIWPTNPIIMNDILNFEFYQVAIMTSAFALIIGITQILGGRIVDRVGRKPFIIISVFILVFFPVSMVPAILTNNWWLLIISRIVGGIGTGFNLIAVNAYTLDLAPEDLFGGYSGVRETFYGVATFIGSFASGFIIEALDVAYGIETTVLIMSIGVTILRAIIAIGYLFISESLPATKLLHNESN